MVFHGEVGALAGMDSEFDSIPASGRGRLSSLLFLFCWKPDFVIVLPCQNLCLPVYTACRHVFLRTINHGPHSSSALCCHATNFKFVTICIHESANYQLKPFFTHWMQPLKQETTPIKNDISCWSGWPCWNGLRIWFLPASGRGRKGRQRIQFYIGWFSSSPFSLPSTQSAHITRGVKLGTGKSVTNQGIYPIFMMHNISPSFTSSSIIYGFIYLYYCTHSFTIPLFASCLSFVCFSLRKVHLPLQVTAFPTLFKTNHISFWVWLKEKNRSNDHDSPGFLLVLRYFFYGQSLIMLYCYIKAFAFLLTPPPTTFTALYCHCHQHCLSQSAYINLSTISSSLFSSIAPSTLKAKTFPNITRNTSSFSSSSQANTVNHSPLKSLPFYCTSYFSNLRSVRMKLSACYIPNIFLKCLFQFPLSTQSAHRTHKVQN